MNDLLQFVDVYVVVIGSLLGSFKASVEFDKDKTFWPRCVDVATGLFIGIAVAFHFGATFSLWLSGLLAVVGGASGAMVLEVVMQMIPSVTRKVVKDWIDHKLK